jgi:hypothetical protein
VARLMPLARMSSVTSARSSGAVQSGPCGRARRTKRRQVGAAERMVRDGSRNIVVGDQVRTGTLRRTVLRGGYQELARAESAFPHGFLCRALAPRASCHEAMNAASGGPAEAALARRTRLARASRMLVTDELGYVDLGPPESTVRTAAAMPYPIRGTSWPGRATNQPLNPRCAHVVP